MRSVIPYADIMKISDEETALLTGHEDPDEAADALLAQGVSLRTGDHWGSQGALMKTEKFRVQEKGKARKAVDTTGAGDAFWGGILSRFAFYSANPKELTEEQGREFVRFAQRGGRPLRGKTGRHTRYAGSGGGAEGSMKILLTAVNAKYIHSNLAVYSLKAYAERQGDSCLSAGIYHQSAAG